ncbi:hypothetical protein BDF22DRAFT_652811 [Syncephalis plumigaleata]|nr:hypothetical protein BDF22DRAFT_652811 [Syncephalis plumigaleata]
MAERGVGATIVKVDVDDDDDEVAAVGAVLASNLALSSLSSVNDDDSELVNLAESSAKIALKLDTAAAADNNCADGCDPLLRLGLDMPAELEGLAFSVVSVLCLRITASMTAGSRTGGGSASPSQSPEAEVNTDMARGVVARFSDTLRRDIGGAGSTPPLRLPPTPETISITGKLLVVGVVVADVANEERRRCITGGGNEEKLLRSAADPLAELLV